MDYSFDKQIVSGCIDILIDFKESLKNDKIKKITKNELFLAIFALQGTVRKPIYLVKLDRLMNSSSAELVSIIKDSNFHSWKDRRSDTY